MGYKYYLFDLDGTLTDPAQGITNSIMYAVRKMGDVPPERSRLYKYIGPPLRNSFEDMGYIGESADRALAYYREYYEVKGMFENSVYPGMEDTLMRLKAAGGTLCVATSKPEKYAKIIIEEFGLGKYFHLVAGSTFDETRLTKDQVIKYALTELGISNLSSVIMIGDRKFDILGGHACGVKAAGVLYGYGSRRELEEAGADAVIETVEDIACLAQE